MPQQRTGSARKKQDDYSDGPWFSWPETDPAERAIRFITTYCRPPKGYGAREPMQLASFQVEWIREILAPGVTAAVMSCPRGQGKSTLEAALALWSVFDIPLSGDPSVPVIATRTAQAMRSVYDVAVRMVQFAPELDARCIIYSAIGSARIDVGATGGTCFPMANNVDGLQGLDPSFAICDEIGFQPLESWDSLILATSKRQNARVIGIGTPGFDRDNALWHLRSAIMQGADLPGFIYKEFAADPDCDLDDEQQWFTANPALAAGFQNIDALRTARAITPASHFRTFHLGQWVDGTDGWLGADGGRVWDGCRDPYQLVDGAPTWAGLDVAVKHDSTALVVAQRRPDGRLHVTCKLWHAPGDDGINLSAIMQTIRELDQRYKLVEVAYDPRLFELAAGMLADEGLPMLEMPQSIERMAPAFGNLLEAIKRREITHNADEGFRMQVMNAIPRYSERGFTLQKNKSRGKIDACYALAMAHARASIPQAIKSPVVVL